MWMDHRALQETMVINATDHPILQFVGGAISSEMEMPKILWIKKVLLLYCSAIGIEVSWFYLCS